MPSNLQYFNFLLTIIQFYTLIPYDLAQYTHYISIVTKALFSLLFSKYNLFCLYFNYYHYYENGCVSSEVLISVESANGMPKSNSKQGCFIHFHTNTLGKI